MLDADINERDGSVAVHDRRPEDHQTVLSTMSSAAAAKTHRSFHRWANYCSHLYATMNHFKRCGNRCLPRLYLSGWTLCWPLNEDQKQVDYIPGMSLGIAYLGGT